MCYNSSMSPDENGNSAKRSRDAWVRFLLTRAAGCVIDTGAMGLAYLGAFALRMDFREPACGWRAVEISCSTVWAVQMAALLLTGCYSVPWRRIRTLDLPRYLGAVVLSCGVLTLLRVLLPDGSYCYCRLNCRQSFARFLPYAQAEVERSKAAPCIDDGEDGDSLLFVSSLPWLSFTGLSLPLPQPADSNPRITFGRFFSQDERVLLPVNLTVHHALADGLHVARFFAGLERRAAEFPL